MSATKHTPDNDLGLAMWALFGYESQLEWPAVLLDWEREAYTHCGAFIRTTAAERDRYKAERDELLDFVRIVADRNWWDYSNGEVSWRGESANGNEILFQDVRVEAAALIAKFGGAK